MRIALHKNATTTPKVRSGIHASDEPTSVLVAAGLAVAAWFADARGWPGPEPVHYGPDGSPVTAAPGRAHE